MGHERLKARSTAALVMLSIVAGLWSTAVPAEASADRAMTLAIVGVWSSSSTAKDGSTTNTVVRFSGDGRFSGLLTISDGTCWTYAGTWSIDDAVLTWRYVESSIPLPEEQNIDRDQIVAIDDHRFVARSSLDGETFVFLRQKE